MTDFSIVAWGAEFLNSCPIENQDISIMAGLLRTGNFKSYLDYEPVTNMDNTDFPLVYLAKSFLKSCALPGYASSARSKAVERFFEAESRCFAANRRLEGPAPRYFDERLKVASKIIEDLIGRHANIGKLLSLQSWTDGTDSVSPYGFTSDYQKYAATAPECTDASLTIVSRFVNDCPKWASYLTKAYYKNLALPVSVLPSRFTLVPGNKVTFVPKNAKTDRAIAIEPHLNMRVQRSIGVFFRDRLMEVGIDLTDQSTNQFLAELGSVSDDIATIDLAMASDTLCYRLVQLLLPPHWFSLLDAVRSKQGSYTDENGTMHTIAYEKFSSMGNGFTFELETLIFWALSKSVCISDWPALSSYVSVYGDDIILPSKYAGDLISLLNHVGFTTNHEKTFITGPFRESCGEDYLEGRNIRPFFIKENILSHHRRAFYKLANAIRSYYGYAGHNPRVNAWLHSHWRHIVESIRKPHFIPLNFGPEQGIQVSEDEVPAASRKRDGRYHFKYIGVETDIDAERERYARAKRHFERGHGNLLLLIAFKRIRGSFVDFINIPLEPNDIHFNISKGSSIKYSSRYTSVWSWNSAPAWHFSV